MADGNASILRPYLASVSSASSSSTRLLSPSRSCMSSAPAFSDCATSAWSASHSPGHQHNMPIEGNHTLASTQQDVQDGAASCQICAD